MVALIYLIKTILISALLFSYYSLFLKNRSFHSFNRYFLLSIPFLSFLLPSLHFTLPVFGNQNVPVSPILLLNVSQGKLEEAVTIYANQHSGVMFSWQSAVWILFISTSLFFLLRLFKSLRFLILLKKEKPNLILKDAVIYFVSEEGTPFSFFKSIFWGNDLDLNSESGNQVLQHELYHVRNNHTADILSMEILTACFWFNPFFFLISREIKAVHEYAADYWVTSKTDTYSYANLLLLKVSGKSLPLTLPFFKSQLKRRIAMMTKPKKNRTVAFGRLMVIPLITVLICLFSFKSANPLHLFSSKTIRVVIDAGHGGIDPGIMTNNILEKNTNLSIAKKIQELSKEYNVEVIMTRERDELPGNVNDINWSLKYRSALARKENADLFISIHTGGGSEDVKSGFEIYVPENQSKIYTGSVKLASCITGYIKPDYTISSDLKQRAQGILVLTHASVPAVLIECGNLNNKSDFEFIQNDKNQEKIARDILEGIKKYSIQNISTRMPLINTTDTVPAVDTITEATMNKIDGSEITMLNLDKVAGLITVNTKNGKTYVIKITPEMRHSMDSSREAQMSHPDTTNANNTVFTKVEVEAEYPGGYKAWYDYLIKNLKYPEAAIKKEIQGEVIVEFIVKRNGDLTDIHIISGPEELRETSLNILKESGKWLPAKQNGIIVDSYHRQPINYKLQ